MQIPLKRLDPELPIPAQAHPGDGGVDLYAAAGIRLAPGERSLVPTGVAVAIPAGFAGLVTPRSGLAVSSGIGIVNLLDACRLSTESLLRRYTTPAPEHKTRLANSIDLPSSI